MQLKMLTRLDADSTRLTTVVIVRQSVYGSPVLSTECVKPISVVVLSCRSEALVSQDT